MKKLFVILLSILMILLIFASCDTGGEEKSSEPEEESSIPVKSPIPYTAEDQGYFEKYAQKLWNCPEYDNQEEQTYLAIHKLFAYVSVEFDGADELAYYNKEDGKVVVPVQLVTDTMKKYFGNSYENVLKLDPAYDANQKVMRWESYGGFGGATIGYPAPIRKEGDVVVVPFYWYNDQNRIRAAKEFWIREFEDGFYILKIAELTEDEIAHLNEKYFGEA